MKPISDLVAPHIVISTLPPQYLQRPRHTLRSHFHRAPYDGAGFDRARCARDERDGGLVDSMEVGDYGAGGVVKGGGGAGGGFAGEFHATGDGALAVGPQLGFCGADTFGVAGGGKVGGGVLGRLFQCPCFGDNATYFFGFFGVGGGS